MSLLPEEASFEELVQECFLAHRGAGLMLSPLDAELMGDWARRAVPFEVVARGIRSAAQKAMFDARPGEPLLRTLRACRKAVEAEIARHQRASAGAGTAPSPASSRKRRATLTLLSERTPALARAIRRIEEAVLPRADANEDLVVALLLRALPFDERLAVLRAARAETEGTSARSPMARRLAARFHLSVQLAARLGVTSFW